MWYCFRCVINIYEFYETQLTKALAQNNPDFICLYKIELSSLMFFSFTRLIIRHIGGITRLPLKLSFIGISNDCTLKSNVSNHVFKFILHPYLARKFAPNMPICWKLKEALLLPGINYICDCDTKSFDFPFCSAVLSNIYFLKFILKVFLNYPYIGSYIYDEIHRLSTQI